MSVRFGDLISETVGPDLDEGEQAATIKKAELPRDPKTGEFIKSFGKNVCDVTFTIKETQDEVRRRYTVTYGQNSETGAWSAFSELVAAATGTPCGSKQQYDVTTTDIEGQDVRVVLKRVEKNSKTYLNVVNVLGPKRSNTRQPAKPDFSFKGERNAAPADDGGDMNFDGLDDKIPF